MKSLLDRLDFDSAVFLCGAGASRNSGLPTVADFYGVLLDALGLGEGDSVGLMSKLHALQIPFEQVVELLLEEGVQSAFLRLFQLGTPNANHRLLARLLENGSCARVYTTNFDLLFEHAIAELQSMDGEDELSVWRESELVDGFSTRHKPIVKIHGSAVAEGVSELRTTLSRVANESWVNAVRGCLEGAFVSGPHERVIVLGYSLSDKFDVNPIVLGFEGRAKEIVYVSHSSENTITSLRDSCTLFGGKDFDGYCVKMNTDAFVEYLWRRYLDQAYVGTMSSCCAWDVTLRSVMAAVRRPKALRILGLAYRTASDFSRAKNFLRQSNDIAAHAEDWRALRARNHNMLATIETYEPDYRAAIHDLREALSIARQSSDAQLKSDVYFSVGRYHEERGRLRQAMRFQRKSLNLCGGDMTSRAKSLHQIGVIHQELGELVRARDLYVESMELKRLAGHALGIGRSLHQLGNVEYLSERYEEASEYYERAIASFTLLGDIQDTARSRYMLGLAHKKRGNYALASRHFRASLRDKRRLSDSKGVARNLNELGYLRDRRHQFRSARILLSCARAISDQIDFDEGRFTSLLYLSESYLDEGLLEHADAAGRKALQISIRLGRDANASEARDLLLRIVAVRGASR